MINEAPPDAPPPTRVIPPVPGWVLWGLVAMFFAGIIALQLAPSPPEEKGFREGALIRQIKMGEALEALQSPRNPATPSPSAPTWRTVAIEAKPFAARSDRARMFLSMAEWELGQRVDPAVAARLKKSKDPVAVLAGKVYAPEPPSKVILEEFLRPGEVHAMLEQHARQRLDLAPRPRAEFGIGAVLPIMGAGLWIFFMLLLGLIAWTAHGLLFEKKSWAPLPVPFSQDPKPLAGWLALLCTALCGVYFIGGGLAAALVPRPPLLGSALFGLAFMLGTVLILTHGKFLGLNLREQLLGKRFSPGKLVGIGFLGYAANVPVLAILIALSTPLLRQSGASHPVSDMLQTSPGPWVWVSAFLAAAVIAPVWEEIVFRGMLFPALARATGHLWVGILGSSFLFAAIHPQGPVLWLMLGWLGVMGCILVRHTGSIVPAIVMHAAHNGTILLVSFILFS